MAKDWDDVRKRKGKVLNGVGPHEKRAKSDANLGARFLRRLQCPASNLRLARVTKESACITVFINII